MSMVAFLLGVIVATFIPLITSFFPITCMLGIPYCGYIQTILFATIIGLLLNKAGLFR